MNAHQESVKQFIELASGSKIPVRPEIPDKKVRLLCAQLILEEMRETIAALGYDVRYDNLDAGLYLVETNPVDIIEVADGIADSHYVLSYAACKFGIREQPIQEEVNLNNLKKFDNWSKAELDMYKEYEYTVTKLANGYWCVKDKNGKVQKPPTHKKPDIKALLELQGWTQS